MNLDGNRILKIGLWIAIFLHIALTLFLLIAGGFAIVFIIGTGILLLYNVALLVALRFFQKKKPKEHILFKLLWLLFLIPVAWAFIDFEGLINFLLQGVSLDMR